MAEFRNVSPLGKLDVPAIRREGDNAVEPDEIIEINDPDMTASFAAQVGVWEEVSS